MKKLLAAVLAVLLVAALGACTQLSFGSGPAARFDGNTSGASGFTGMLVNSAGMTLYTFDRDAAGSGKSVCNGQCAVNWPPLSAATSTMSSASLQADWSIVVRDDGSKQWAYKGKPVYLFAKDQKPGDKTGDGVNKVWHIVTR